MDEIIQKIQDLKREAFETLHTDFPRSKTFRALDEAEKIAGWELADHQETKKE